MKNKILKISTLVTVFVLGLLIYSGTVAAAPPLSKNLKTTPPGTGEGVLKNAGAQNRAVLIGANLVSVSGAILTVTTGGKTITVTTDEKTKFRRKFWGKGSLTEMQSGDLLTIHGKYTDTQRTKVLASQVRDNSIQKRNGTFAGRIQTVNPSGFVMETASRGNQTVTISTNTKITNRVGTIIPGERLLAGHKVRVRGLWNKTVNTITEVTAIKDYSLPVISKVKPTVTVTE